MIKKLIILKGRKIVNITVVSMGYVGLSNAILLVQNNQVKALEIVEEKVEMINNKQSPIVDHEIQDYFTNKSTTE